MKKLRFLFLYLLITFSLSACDNKKDEVKSDKPTVKIGVIMSFTGSDPEGANNAKNALLFIKNNKLKSSNVNYEFVFEDSHGEASKGLSAAKKLVTYDKVQIIFSNISAVSKVISNYLEAKKIPHIAFSSDKETANGKTNFVFWISAEEYAEKMFNLLQKQNAKNVLAFVNLDITSTQRYNALSTIIKDSEIILNKEDIVPGNRDFRIAINQAINEKPDMILLLAPLPELDILAKQLKEMGNTAPLTSMDFINYSQQKELFEGSVYVSTGDGNKNVIEEIMSAINTKNPFSLAYMNDALMMVDNVVSAFYEKNNILPSGDDFAESLIKLKTFDGAVGNIVINNNGIINPQAIIKTIKNGKPVVVE